ncbi:hypothetical protein B0T18DRAFT_51025 [Schizothecium vesticola]|uniref:Uncharacterized protein n=1 Tax=Schizothecium vesticola TaxID=314040 RepID=A0AA40FC94_9PEZI|nr:hypothetical protein B0T18DRAFT_51025 [Schizothecium vesticola]
MVHCYQTHIFEKKTREQARSASHSSGRGTLHKPQAAPSVASHRSAGWFAPGFCSLSPPPKQPGQDQRRAARRGAELTRATLFVGRRTTACQLLSRVLPPRRNPTGHTWLTVRGSASAERKAAAACRAARPERRAARPWPSGAAPVSNPPDSQPSRDVSDVEFASSAVRLRDQQGKMLRTQSLVVTGSIRPTTLTGFLLPKEKKSRDQGWEKRDGKGDLPAIHVAGANDGMTRGCDGEMRLRRLPPPPRISLVSSRPRNN